MSSRRRFLAQTAMAVAGTTVVPTVLAQSGPLQSRPGRRHRVVDLDQLEFEDFERLVDTAFVVRAADSARTVLLVSAERGPGAVTTGAPRSETFSLLFEHGTGGRLDQGTYRFYHSRLGEFGMFIVPVARSRRGQAYEAVFNRLMV